MFKSSEVFTYMNDEAVRSDDEKENQSDTAFLQRCNRSKSNIIEDSENLDEIDMMQTDDINSKNENDSIEEPDDLPELSKCDEINQSDCAKIIEHSETRTEQKTVFEDFERCKNHQNSSDSYETIQQYIESQEDVKKQISNIQKQIHKLSNLPLIIQTAIDDIAIQISELLPALQDNRISESDDFDLCRNVPIEKNVAQNLQTKNASTVDDTPTEDIETKVQNSNQRDSFSLHPSDVKENLFNEEQPKVNHIHFLNSNDNLAYLFYLRTK